MRHHHILLHTCFLMALALSLTSCQQEESLTGAEAAPISFSPYVRHSLTRAGETGEQTIASLKESGKGFGVFAYYTDASSYTAMNPEGVPTLAPNFMYNEHVYWTDPVATTANGNTTIADGSVSLSDKARWVYSPIKFWPNEHGASAASADIDRLSFFAYAPYVKVTPENGETVPASTTGIYKLTKATDKGDPKIYYNASSQVDLLWAVVPQTPATETSSGSGIWIVDDPETIENGPTLTAGLPWLDMTKQKVNGTVRLHFLHALAGVRFGKIRAIFDETENPDVDYTDLAAYTAPSIAKKREDRTRITVESIRISGVEGYSKGVLNLNNTEAFKPRWELEEGDKETNGSAEYSADINPWLKNDPNYFTSETDLTSAALAETEHPVGIIHQNLPLFSADGTTAAPTIYLLLNPYDTDGVQDITLTITYYTNTYDPGLANHWSRIENKISKSVRVSNQPGKLTTIQILVGMTSVKLEASVTDWDDGDSKEVYLPQND